MEDVVIVAGARTAIGKFNGGFAQTPGGRPDVVTTAVGLLAGIFVVLLGATGFGSGLHGPLGRISRRVRHVLKP